MSSASTNEKVNKNLLGTFFSYSFCFICWFAVKKNEQDLHSQFTATSVCVCCTSKVNKVASVVWEWIETRQKINFKPQIVWLDHYLVNFVTS